jgi:hypothetical protein
LHCVENLPSESNRTGSGSIGAKPLFYPIVASLCIEIVKKAVHSQPIAGIVLRNEDSRSASQGDGQYRYDWRPVLADGAPVIDGIIAGIVPVWFYRRTI